MFLQSPTTTYLSAQFDERVIRKTPCSMWCAAHCAAVLQTAEAFTTHGRTTLDSLRASVPIDVPTQPQNQTINKRNTNGVPSK